jgi:hypothetical protein
VNGKALLRTVEADVEIGIIVSTEQYQEMEMCYLSTRKNTSAPLITLIQTM